MSPLWRADFHILQKRPAAGLVCNSHELKKVRFPFSKPRQLLYLIVILLALAFVAFTRYAASDSLKAANTPGYHGSRALFTSYAPPDALASAANFAFWICGLLGAGAGYLLYQSRRSYVEVDEHGVTLQLSKGTSSMPWSEVKALVVDPLNEKIVLKSSDRELSILWHFESWDRFVDEARARIPAEAQKAAPPQLNRLVTVDPVGWLETLMTWAFRLYPFFGIALAVMVCPFQVLDKYTYESRPPEQWIADLQVHPIFWKPERLEGRVGLIHWPFWGFEIALVLASGYLIYRRRTAA